MAVAASRRMALAVPTVPAYTTPTTPLLVGSSNRTVATTLATATPPAAGQMEPMLVNRVPVAAPAFSSMPLPQRLPFRCTVAREALAPSPRGPTLHPSLWRTCSPLPEAPELSRPISCPTATPATALVVWSIRIQTTTQCQTRLTVCRRSTRPVSSPRWTLCFLLSLSFNESISMSRSMHCYIHTPFCCQFHT